VASHTTLVKSNHSKTIGLPSSRRHRKTRPPASLGAQHGQARKSSSDDRPDRDHRRWPKCSWPIPMLFPAARLLKKRPNKSAKNSSVRAVYSSDRWAQGRRSDLGCGGPQVTSTCRHLDVSRGGGRPPSMREAGAGGSAGSRPESQPPGSDRLPEQERHPALHRYRRLVTLMLLDEAPPAEALKAIRIRAAPPAIASSQPPQCDQIAGPQVLSSPSTPEATEQPH